MINKNFKKCLGISLMSLGLLSGLTSCALVDKVLGDKPGENSNPPIVNPSNPDEPDIPDISFPDIDNPDINNPDVTDPDGPVNPKPDTPTPNPDDTNHKKIKVNSFSELNDEFLKELAANDLNAPVEDIQIANPNWKSQITVDAKEITVTLTATVGDTTKTYIYTIDITDAQKKNTLIINGFSTIRIKLGKITTKEDFEAYVLANYTLTNALYEDVDGKIEIVSSDVDLLHPGEYEIVLKAKTNDGKLSTIKNIPVTVLSTQKYLVTFLDGNGNKLYEVTVEEGEAVEYKGERLPIKEDDLWYSYTFNGWDADFTNITSNLVVKPTFNKIEKFYTLSFETKNGEELESVRVLKNDTLEKVLASHSNIKKKGFTFTGWYLDTTCLNPVTKDYTISENMTIYAGWEEVDMTVNYYFNGEKIQTLKNTLSNKTDLLNYIPTLGKKYEFEGWYLDKEFTKPFSIDEYQTTINVYAKATKITLEHNITVKGMAEYYNYSVTYSPRFLFIETANHRYDATPNYGNAKAQFWAVPINFFTKTNYIELTTATTSSVYPDANGTINANGLAGTKWYKITEAEYNKGSFNFLNRTQVELPYMSDKNFWGQNEWTTITKYKISLNTSCDHSKKNDGITPLFNSFVNQEGKEQKFGYGTLERNMEDTIPESGDCFRAENEAVATRGQKLYYRTVKAKTSSYQMTNKTDSYVLEDETLILNYLENLNLEMTFFELNGFYLDPEFKTKIDGTTKITSDMTVYAKWDRK